MTSEKLVLGSNLGTSQKPEVDWSKTRSDQRATRSDLRETISNSTETRRDSTEMMGQKRKA